MEPSEQRMVPHELLACWMFQLPVLDSVASRDAHRFSCSTSNSTLARLHPAPWNHADACFPSRADFLLGVVRRGDCSRTFLRSPTPAAHCGTGNHARNCGSSLHRIHPSLRGTDLGRLTRSAGIDFASRHALHRNL